MTPEWITAIGTAGTFFVILISAIAALKQLRHMRGSNQIVALTECRETLESPEFRAAQNLVSWELAQRLNDPVEARRLTETPLAGEYEAIPMVANFFESMGLFVKTGIIDEDIACDFWSHVVIRNWYALSPVVTYFRRKASNPNLWVNFEYMAVVAEQANKHPSYPVKHRRMPEDDSMLYLIE